ncbi:MAG: hypothetical protein AAFX03_14375 [Pseudomonadota bacterium]
MFFRALFASFAIAAAPAAAQVEVGDLGALDPWGLGYLAEGEPSLPSDFWRASVAEDLLPLMNRARTSNLTPVERTLLRRVVLSPGARPGGDKEKDLLAERARIMFDLGEAAAAADLMSRLEQSPTGLNSEEVAADLELALGNEASACEKAESPPNERPFWMKLRTVCFALQDDFDRAALAIELAESQGVADQWLWAAVLAASGESPNRPDARFETGLTLSISAKSQLRPATETATASRPDLAAAIARREAFTPDIRVQSAGAAAESGLIDASEHRAAYEALLGVEGFNPGTALEAAVATASNPDATLDDEGRTLASALATAQGNPARYAAVSRLLKSDLDALEPVDALDRYALRFARASLAAGDAAAATAWAASAAPEEGDEASSVDPFEVAWIEGLAILAGLDRSEAEIAEVGARIAETARGQAREAAAVKLFSPTHRPSRRSYRRSQILRRKSIPPRPVPSTPPR